MTVKFYTDKPSNLLAKFKEKIEIGNKKGGISGWTLKNGSFFHASSELKDAKLSAKIVTDAKYPHIEFHVIRSGESLVSIFSYKELHGNLIATFIEHFSSDFSSASIVSKMK